MAGRFSPVWLDELRARADIVSIVSEYVVLKQNGRRYWGLCPFHNEKTASFSVDADRQLYHCFGCKAGGSVIQFVMDIERLEFPEAVRHLAERAHMPLPDLVEDPTYERTRSLKERIYAANKAAAHWYHEQLWQPESAQILEYLYHRGLDDATIRRFGLGAASGTWEALTNALTAQGFTREELIQAGLTVEKNDRTYDMFRQRALFPIINVHGQVLGFGGRAMGDAQPKYLNTPDTPVFNKRQGVYAINLLRKARDLRRIVLVEGYMDVVSLVQRGITGVLATLGTALTPEQARLMKRYAPEIWVTYDGDSAGQQAILRALEIMEGEEVPAKVLTFPGAKDPDEFVQKNGVEAFLALRPMDATTYRMNHLAGAYDLSEEAGRTEYAKACAPVLRKVREPVELENHLRHLSLVTGFSRDVLMQQVGHGAAGMAARPSYVPRRNPLSTPATALPDHLKAERSLLSLLSAKRIEASLLDGIEFASPLHGQLAQRLGEGESPSSILEQTTDDAERREIAEILGTELKGEEDQALRMAADCLIRIQRHRLQERIDALKQEIATLTGDDRRDVVAQVDALMQELNRLKSGRKE